LSLARWLGLCGSLVLLIAAPGCTVEEGPPDVGRLDATVLDAARDVPAVSCTSAAECDDEIACTFDDCVVGNVCSHMPLDTLCEDGERCDLTRGCTAGCATLADCNVDRNYCDGMYACNAGNCVPSLARNCDDGNECTVDSCDPTAMDGAGGCVYALATGCDGGVGAGDAGVPVCDPFVPATGYAGTFRMAPVLSLDCIEDYSIMNMTFSVSGGMLRVTGAPSFGATLTGPVPSGATFTVSGSSSCGDYTLTGTFACANRFSGMFTSSFSSECSICGGGTTTVVGRI
jgi:hypothetical protein